jgi:hypothetical protein
MRELSPSGGTSSFSTASMRFHSRLSCLGRALSSTGTMLESKSTENRTLLSLEMAAGFSGMPVMLDIPIPGIPMIPDIPDSPMPIPDIPDIPIPDKPILDMPMPGMSCMLLRLSKADVSQEVCSDGSKDVLKTSTVPPAADAHGDGEQERDRH